jgi:4-diphosphocytidyl-2-C-methyl-D-erythritol kinase
MKLSVPAPAKVNLLLKVLGRRADGYHTLASIVDVVSLADTLHIEELDEDRVLVDDDLGVLPAGAANTIYRAAVRLKEVFRISRGVRVFVQKRIPIGAGLGGPSSDAAATLRALADAWHLTVTPERLRELGAGIGADVPLFLYGKSCFMEGIGERITPLRLPRAWYVIVYPGIVLHTKDVYENLKISLTSGQNDITLSWKFDTVFDLARILENDLERSAFSLCREI